MEPTPEFLEMLARCEEPNPALQRLPHPARLDALRFDELLTWMMGPALEQLEPMLLDPAVSVDAIMHAVSGIEDFGALQAVSQAHPHNSNAGVLRGNLIYLRYRALQGILFQTTSALETLLSEADIGEDARIGDLRAPFPACFIAFGDRGAHSNLMLTDPFGRGYPLEGLYVMEDLLTVDPDDNAQAPALKAICGGRTGERVRALTLLYSGSPRGGANALDDYVETNTLYLPVSDAEKPLRPLLDEQARAMRQLSQERGAEAFTAAQEAEQMAGLEHLIKVLLYLNVRSARTQQVNEYTEMAARVERAKGGKRKKLERRLEPLYDREEVGPERLPDELAHAWSGAGGEKRPHWRRGHFHTVLFGPGRQQRRLEFFPPTLVRADRLEGREPAPKPYTIDVGPILPGGS